MSALLVTPDIHSMHHSVIIGELLAQLDIVLTGGIEFGLNGAEGGGVVAALALHFRAGSVEVGPQLFQLCVCCVKVTSQLGNSVL